MKKKKISAGDQIIAQTCYFSDIKGYKYKLYPDTCKHIRLMHPEIENPVTFIQKVFDKTFAIYESTKSREIYLYYNIKSKSLYRVVVANIINRVIKTAYISDKLKKGDLIWIDKSLLLH
jgi:hypothetical protein